MFFPFSVSHNHTVICTRESGIFTITTTVRDPGLHFCVSAVSRLSLDAKSTPVPTSVRVSRQYRHSSTFLQRTFRHMTPRHAFQHIFFHRSASGLLHSTHHRSVHMHHRHTSALLALHDLIFGRHLQLRLLPPSCVPLFACADAAPIWVAMFLLQGIRQVICSITHVDFTLSRMPEARLARNNTTTPRC